MCLSLNILIMTEEECGEYQKCFELTTSLFERDPFHLKCTVVHIVTSMELGHKNELYLMACNLVKDYSQKAISWFAVGCYYNKEV
jgi:anaphase-promoting complex subunit 6